MQTSKQKQNKEWRKRKNEKQKHISYFRVDNEIPAAYEKHLRQEEETDNKKVGIMGIKEKRILIRYESRKL